MLCPQLCMGISPRRYTCFDLPAPLHQGQVAPYVDTCPAGDVRAPPGRPVQVDPMQPMLKAPGTKHLKLMCDILLSSFALKYNLRRYIQAAQQQGGR